MAKTTIDGSMVDGSIEFPPVDIASATTTDIGAAAGNVVRITGTTTITSFGTAANRLRFVHFAGILTLTHNATTMILPGGANVVTAEGDSLIAISDGSGNWRVINYQYASYVGPELENLVSVAEPQAFSDAGKIQARQNIYAAPASGVFVKAASDACVLAKTGAGTATIAAETAVEVGGTVVSFAVAAAIVMPALTAGTDYAVYVCSDGTVRADASFSAPSGYTTANSRQVGGFHYAPGGNATGTSGGDTTPAINQHSLWDLKWRPACDDPRGMALVAGSFWCDIYLLGVDHHTNGSSKYNVTIADGTTPPKIPTAFGGDGSTAYGNLTWWVSGEVLQSHGKQPLTYDEFAAAAYGTTEATSGGTDPVSTILRQAYTSKWGVMLATGNLWVWGRHFGGGSAGAAWAATTGGRGSTYQLENAALWGGAWSAGADSGSRCSLWSNPPTNSIDSIGARGRCDHLILA